MKTIAGVINEVFFFCFFFAEVPLSKPEQFIEIASPFLSHCIKSNAGSAPELCVHSDLKIRDFVCTCVCAHITASQTVI